MKPISHVSDATRRVTLLFVAAALCCGALRGPAADAPKLPPLSTASGGAKLPGKFVWADLVTHDVPAVSKFYGQVCGWTFQDIGGYLIASNDGRPVAGLLQRPKPGDPNARPRWFGYISVPSVSRAESAVKKSGGKVVAAPTKFPNRGEQAVFLDPEGVPFGVVRSSSGDPEDFLAGPGDWIWIQLLSRDGKKASEFYRSVGGYKIIESTPGDKSGDFVLESEGFARATVRNIPPEQDRVKPDWLLFVRVKSVKDSIALVKQLGGKVLLEPGADLFDGRVTVIADPTGAAIGLLEWNEPTPEGAR